MLPKLVGVIVVTVLVYMSEQLRPFTIPIFIAITALCRLIILQGKGISTIDLIYESGAVLLLALAALIMKLELHGSSMTSKAVTTESDRSDHA